MRMRGIKVTAVVLGLAAGAPLTRISGQPAFPFQNPDLPLQERVEDLVSRMTLEEKASQMQDWARAIPRLGIPEYGWWNECLHGVARAGTATVFPQAIGLAATFDTDLMLQVAAAISDEARAKHHEFVRNGKRKRYQGLTYWSPNVNIFRDPRWGRGQETYGEDPYLAARMGVAFVRGLQGDDPEYLKLVATPKHYAVHSGPEPERHRFDAAADRRDLYETYLPAFKAAVTEAGAGSVMGAYNRTNGEACCAHRQLLGEILRGEWGFKGYVVSDCGAIEDIWRGHRLARTEAEASALAVKTGCDLDCGREYRSLTEAVKTGLITEAEIDAAVKRLFEARFRLGLFDPPERVAWARIPFEKNDCPEHRALALEAARRSMVLLKNTDGFLPLPRNLKAILVTGPNADEASVMFGNYNGTPSSSVTPLAGIRSAASPGTAVMFAPGCDWTREDPAAAAAAVDSARKADAVVFVGGISPRLEGEEMRVDAPGFLGGDRTDIRLPAVQTGLLQALHGTGKPVVLVLLTGSAIAVPWEHDHLRAILAAWYPGQAGGTALADVLFGDFNPAGRLPVTFYRSNDQLPPFEDYRMEGRTYRYFTGEPLYPFGFGLSYTTFEYAGLEVPKTAVPAGRSAVITVTVRNTGEIPGDEVVQLYLKDIEASTPRPIRSLKGFRRVHLNPGESKTVSFTITPEDLSLIDASGAWTVEPGVFEAAVGPSSADLRLKAAFTIAG
ncbi:MAG: glycoside hydrolase family 3 C-terminal domain-containing protein [bacterium]|nr:glycoside hydrolase family 3 C-terminal domain-containing protein [bacterium]